MDELDKVALKKRALNKKRSLKSPFPYAVASEERTSNPDLLNTILGLIDLNHPDLYDKKIYKGKTSRELYDILWTKLGWAIVYIEFVHPEFGESQLKRIKENYGKALRIISEDLQPLFCNDSPAHRMILMKMIEKFSWDTENLC